MEPVHRRIPPGHEFTLPLVRIYVYKKPYVGSNGKRILLRRRFYPSITWRKLRGKRLP